MHKYAGENMKYAGVNDSNIVDLGEDNMQPTYIRKSYFRLDAVNL